jgi:hypothetical protein
MRRHNSKLQATTPLKTAAGEGWDEGFIKQGVSSYTPHPNPLPQGARGL